MLLLFGALQHDLPIVFELLGLAHILLQQHPTIQHVLLSEIKNVRVLIQKFNSNSSKFLQFPGLKQPDSFDVLLGADSLRHPNLNLPRSSELVEQRALLPKEKNSPKE